MVSLKLLTCILSAASVLALPTPVFEAVPELDARQTSDGATCGSNFYSNSNINDAINAGYDYYEDDETVGSDSYPHQYNDYEGFSFSTSSPWYEFPILANHEIFDGSTSPGADRVIFDSNGEFTAVLTHTGASGNDFNECSY